MKRLLLAGAFAVAAFAEDRPSPERAAVAAEMEEVLGGGGVGEAADRLARMDPFPAEIVAESVDALDRRERLAALAACEQAGPAAKAAVPALAEALGDYSGEIRTGALAALRACGPEAEAAIPVLLNRVRSADPLTNSGAAEILLFGMGRAGRDAVRAAMTDPDAAASAKVTTAFQRVLHGSAAAPWILLAEALAGEKDVWRRLSAAKNATHCRSAAGADSLLPALVSALLEDPDAAVRAAAAASLPELARLGADFRERAREALAASAMEDPDEGVKRAAAEAGRKIAGK